MPAPESSFFRIPKFTAVGLILVTRRPFAAAGNRKLPVESQPAVFDAHRRHQPYLRTDRHAVFCLSQTASYQRGVESIDMTFVFCF
jgi:hypothetical protein